MLVRRSYKSTSFRDVKPGQVFVLDNHVFMKIFWRTEAGLSRDCNYRDFHHAVSLTDGEILALVVSTQVELVPNFEGVMP